eukprot:scaffold7218_cov152-Skeletonema_marinoi.AAC.1
MSFALSKMLDGTSSEEALLAIFSAWGNVVALMLWMLSKQTERANGEWDELHFGVVEIFNNFFACIGDACFTACACFAGSSASLKLALFRCDE